MEHENKLDKSIDFLTHQENTDEDCLKFFKCMRRQWSMRPSLTRALLFKLIDRICPGTV